MISRHNTIYQTRKRAEHSTLQANKKTRDEISSHYGPFMSLNWSTGAINRAGCHLGEFFQFRGKYSQKIPSVFVITNSKFENFPQPNMCTVPCMQIAAKGHGYVRAGMEKVNIFAINMAKKVDIFAIYLPCGYICHKLEQSLKQL